MRAIQPGSLVDRALTFMEARAPGRWYRTAEIAKAIGATSSATACHLVHPMGNGLLLRRDLEQARATA